MKILLQILIIVLLLTGCEEGDNKNETFKVSIAYNPSIQEVDTGNNVSWNELKQYFNGVPKYSGAVGTYSYKHYPIAIKHGGSNFYTFTDNTQDNNFYVYVVKNNSTPVLVHTFTNWSDPHSNAVINVNNEGYVEVYVSARNVKRSAYKYVSQTPLSLDFICVEGCDGNFRYEAYPQVHNTSWGTTLLYTHYIHEGHTFRSRLPYAKIGDNSYRLADTPMYQVSNYVDGELCTAHNYLVDAIPDQRTNLYFMCTRDGDVWYNASGETLTLPLPDDINGITKVFDTYSKDRLVYVKDIYKYKGKWRVLFISSTSADPTQGYRWLYEWTQGESGVKYVSKMDHNYGGATVAFVNNEIYYLLTKSDNENYLSGKIYVYNESKNLVGETREEGYAYIRRVRGEGSWIVASRQDSEDDKTGKFYYIKLR